MGFGTIATHIILFVAMVTAALGFFVAMNSHTAQLSAALTDQRSRALDQLQSELTIESVSMADANQSVVAYVRNTGRTRVEIEQISIFIDGVRSPQSQTNLSVVADTDIANPTILDPHELLLVNVTQEVNAGVHKFRIAGGPTTDEQIFSR